MNPIEILKAEHRLIERTLVALGAWATGMVIRHADERVELDHFVTFVRDFVDPVHHGKEENILFATMVEHGFSREQGPVAVMLHEHRECRALIGTLAAFVRQGTHWSEAERREIARTALAYSALLRQHIAKEDQILFPISLVRLPDAAKTRIAAGFAHFEAAKVAPAKRAHLRALAESLAARHLPAASAR
jgi:hemerythrin-like domain-containing protein